MPIERTGQVKGVGQGREQGEPGSRRLGGSRWTHRHQAGHVEILVPEARHQLRRPLRRAPAASGQPGHVHLDEDRRSRGADGRWPGPPPAGAPPASRRPAGPDAATLLRWMAPRKCHSGRVVATRGSTQTGRPWPPVRRRSSPRARSALRPRPARAASDPNPLVTATTRTDPGSRPDASIRRRDRGQARPEALASPPHAGGPLTPSPGAGHRVSTRPPGPVVRYRPGPGARSTRRRTPCRRRCRPPDGRRRPPGPRTRPPGGRGPGSPSDVRLRTSSPSRSLTRSRSDSENA